MAENIYCNNLDISDEERTTSEVEEEIYKQIQELSVVEREEKSPKCESCVSKGWYERVAAFLCFVCEIYVCAECWPNHGEHEGMEAWRKEKERKTQREKSVRTEKQRENQKKKIKKQEKSAESERIKDREETERMPEKSERERFLRNFVDRFMDESQIERRQELKNSQVSICDRVEVKHELDKKQTCWITGFCGLENRRLVVCDFGNSCIKILKLGSYVLQRYIRFVEPGPWDVTEIDLRQNSIEPNLMSGSSSDISVTDRVDPDKQSLIAITLPWKRQIMFIDLRKKPAKTQKIINTERQCWSIQYYNDKIFTVCEGPGYPSSVYKLSTDGNKLNSFDIGIYGYPGPHLSVVSGRVYLTDRDNDKVQCRHAEGQVLSERTIKGSRPIGISVDQGNNVYVCARDHNNVYKLDADLRLYKSVLDQTADYMESPRALYYYRDKLFIGHDGPPSLENFVTVVRLL